MAQNDYVVSATALSLTPSGTTVASANTQAASYTVSRTFVRSGLAADELLDTSQTWSIHYVVSATTGLCASRFKLQRLNSSGVMQTESGYFTAHAPIATGTFDEDVTWTSGTWGLNDQVALVWETFRTSGSGNKTATITANGGSYVLEPVPSGVTTTDTGWAATGGLAFGDRALSFTKSDWATATALSFGVSEVGSAGLTYLETGSGVIG